RLRGGLGPGSRRPVVAGSRPGPGAPGDGRLIQPPKETPRMARRRGRRPCIARPPGPLALNTVPPWRRSRPSGGGRLHPLFEGELAELLLGLRLDLADPLLGDPHLLAELLQGHLAGAPEAVAADEDLPLAVVEPAEHPGDRLLVTAVVVLVLVLA